MFYIYFSLLWIDLNEKLNNIESWLIKGYFGGMIGKNRRSKL